MAVESYDDKVSRLEAAANADLQPPAWMDDGPPSEEPIRNGKAVPAGQSPRTLMGRDFADMQPHLKDGYTVKGLITPNSLVGIIGQTGGGKTFFATDLAMHIAAGRSWRNRNVRSGLVVYAALEGPVSAENRFVAARDHAGFEKAIPLRLTPGPINLRDTFDVALLIAFVRQAESDHGAHCVAVFVDTLSRAMAGGDENGPEDMGALIAGADAVRLATDTTVVLVHHMGKDETRGARGHSSLKAALDTEIEVAAKDGIHVATVTKQRDLPSGDAFPFKLRPVELGQDEDGDPVTSCIVEPTEQAPRDRKQPRGKNQARLLAALQEWRRNNPERDFITTIDYRQIAQAQGLIRNRLQEVTEKLEEFGWLESFAGGYRLIEENRR